MASSHKVTEQNASERTVYRLTTAPTIELAFSGEGAAKLGGRWNPSGTRVIYTASCISLAMLEILVNRIPEAKVRTYHLYQATLPEGSIVELKDLPSDWSVYPHSPSTQAVGAGWANSRVSLGLSVPSAVVPAERNVLINPAHRDWSLELVVGPIAFPWDPRLA